MGMYTELFVEGYLKKNTPAKVSEIIRFLFERADTKPKTAPAELPGHKFFQCKRWAAIGNCSSFYHIPFALSDVHMLYNGELAFVSRSDLKDYDYEIAKFVDWLKPHCGLLRGWSWYEEALAPTFFNFEG